MYKYLFGPVRSRRLGLSLGIDLLPHKTCSFNCVYCEQNATTDFVLERTEFFPLAEILEELQICLSSRPELQYISFSGSGEPTLYSRLGEIIAFLKQNYPAYKVALLTNSSLLTDSGVRMEIKKVDLCLPSLDSATQEGFQKIDRPEPGWNMKIGSLIEGIKQTKEILTGEMWLEIFIVPGINDTPQELAALKEAVTYIKPDKVQINYLDRPGTESWVRKPARHSLDDIHKWLQGEIISSANSPA